MEFCDFSKQQLRDLLTTDVTGWNEARRAEPSFEPNLSGLDLSRTNLRGANLKNADLSDVDLTSAHLEGCSLFNARLSHAEMAGAQLHGATLTGSILAGTFIQERALRNVICDYVYLDESGEQRMDLVNKELAALLV